MKELLIDLNYPAFCSSAELLKDYFGSDFVDLRKVTLEQFEEIENKYRITYAYSIVNYAVNKNWLPFSKLTTYDEYRLRIADEFGYANYAYSCVQKLIELIDEENNENNS